MALEPLLFFGIPGLIALTALFFLLRRRPSDAPVASIPSDQDRMKAGLSRTQSFFQRALDKATGSEGEKFYEEMEEALLTADVGIDVSERVLSELKAKWGLKLPLREDLLVGLKSVLRNRFPATAKPDHTLLEGQTGTLSARPYVVLVVGVNGAGKTTTIAKLCARFQNRGLRVLVGAADTYRAAATEQLRTWVERVGAEGVFQKEGADPSSVAFDSVQSARAKGVDLCMIDTAGRLHTKTNLMEELKKMKRVVAKAQEGAPHEIWLVVDGSAGQNALHQAREFHEALGLTGLVVTKLDGSAKGGALVGICSELGVPAVFVGVGEAQEDLIPFSASAYVEAMLAP